VINENGALAKDSAPSKHPQQREMKDRGRN